MCRSGSGSGSGVRCIISLANWSMFTLLDVETNTECGRTSHNFPPRNVFPGYRSVGFELVTKVKRRFGKVSIVSYSRPSLMIIVSASQFTSTYRGFNVRLA